MTRSGNTDLFFPVVEADKAPTRRDLSKQSRNMANAVDAVQRHELIVWVDEEVESINREAATRVVMAAGMAEIRVLRQLMAQAGNSAAAVDIVARMINMHATMNDRRLMHFGRWTP